MVWDLLVGKTYRKGETTNDTQPKGLSPATYPFFGWTYTKESNVFDQVLSIKMSPYKAANTGNNELEPARSIWMLTGNLSLLPLHYQYSPVVNFIDSTISHASFLCMHGCYTKSNFCGVRQQAIFMQCFCNISIFVVVSQLYVYVLHLYFIAFPTPISFFLFMSSCGFMLIFCIFILLFHIHIFSFYSSGVLKA